MVAILVRRLQPDLLASIQNQLPINYLSGAPERIRTSDPQIRSLVLYPAELRAQRASPLKIRGAARDRRHSYRLGGPMASGGRNRSRARSPRE
jgi:hypothetical protein